MNDSVVTACVLIIGNEILSGRTQDTNLRHIAIQLNEWGIRVREARVIPDIESVIIDTVRTLRGQFDYVFTTGGIGPTHDDITADCIAKAFDRKLVIHPEIAHLIQSRAVPPDVMAARMLMARVPEGAGLIGNPSGGPPGFFIENVYVMAGIPTVMQGMLSTARGQTARRRAGPIAFGHRLSRRKSDRRHRSDGFRIVIRTSISAAIRSPANRATAPRWSCAAPSAAGLDAMLEEVIAMIVAAGGEPQDITARMKSRCVVATLALLGSR